MRCGHDFDADFDVVFFSVVAGLTGLESFSHSVNPLVFKAFDGDDGLGGKIGGNRRKERCSK
jgi:hypothetical protein